MEKEADKIDISVIMPSYNAAAFITQSIQSVKEQTLSQWELIIVDDGSNDDTCKLIAPFLVDTRIKLLQQDHLGAARARNQALHRAKGEYIAFLDADDWWEPHFLQTMLKNSRDTGASISYCGWQRTGLAANLCPRYVPPDYSEKGLVEALMRENIWPIHAALTQASLIKELGGFNAQLPCCMDFDLWLRASPDISVALVPEVLAYYRFHGDGQITSQKARLVIVHLEVQLEFLKRRSDIAKRFSCEQIENWTWERVRRKAYENFWRGNLNVSSPLFRYLLKQGKWKTKDLRHTIFSLFPVTLQKKLLVKA
ncbi:glycosyltransferase family 2 protein [Aestuariirhabdus sp. LZHN29]|uniref:glycosyltransferase family 2 protein n=1 Tax=Aestuariirhabdus sp. LZHN29 TaxID=3417462 RepID=UPI003CEF607F